MKKSFPVSFGMATGSFAGIMHILWSVMVALGWAKPWMEWIAELHFIDLSVRFYAFNFGTAILLVIITTIVGFIIGYIFGTIWTAVKKA